MPFVTDVLVKPCPCDVRSPTDVRAIPAIQEGVRATSESRNVLPSVNAADWEGTLLSSGESWNLRLSVPSLPIVVQRDSNHGINRSCSRALPCGH